MMLTTATVSDGDTILMLPMRTRVMAIAAACRETLLTFTNESQHWGKAELAMWLMGPYAMVSQLAEGRAFASGERAVPTMREIDVRMVHRVIRSAREEVFATLERLSDPEATATFAFTMMSSGFVAACEDDKSVKGWIPTTGARRLADRVLSLAAADYLARPSDYETLAVCARCNTVEFDAFARLRGICLRHRSMFVPANDNRRTTVPYAPEGA